MNSISKTLIALGGACWIAAAAAAAGGATPQRTRTVGEQPSTTATPTASTSQPNQTVSTPRPAPAPQSVTAKYEGGIVGYGKSDGTLSFDDGNRRLLFRNKAGKEMFSVPYDVVTAAWPDTKSRSSTAGSVIASTVPYGLGLPALLVRKKSRYLVLQYRDPDTKAEGLASFKLQSKELLASVLNSFAEKAGLTQRGDAFVRRRETPGPAGSQTPNPN